ncbi:MAG: hypothetical protein ACI35M_03205 [Alistipes sp.]
MRKINIHILATAIFALVMSACVKNDSAIDATQQQRTFKGVIADNDSRTTMGEDNSVVWSKDDQIVVLGVTGSAYSAKVFVLASGAGTSAAEFNGTIDDYDAYYGLYPYEMYAGANLSGWFLIDIPNSGIVTERNFIKDANPMVAFCDNSQQLKFKNLCGILEIQLVGSGTVSSIEVVSQDNPISGKFLVSSVDGRMYYNSESSEGGYSTKLSLTLETPIELSSTPRSLYAILPPATYSGLQIRTTDTEGNVTVRTATRAITITRAHITPVSEFTHTSYTEPYANVAYLSERSSWARSLFNVTLNGLATGYYYRFMTYDQYVASGESDIDLVKAGSTRTGSGLLRASVYRQATRYVFLALAFDGDGNTSSHVSKCIYTTPVVPIDESMSVTLSQESVDEDKAVIKAESSESDVVFLYYYCMTVDFTMTRLEEMLDAMWDASSVLAQSTSLELSNLLSDTEYTLIACATHGTKSFNKTTYTDYSKVALIKFTTLGHQASSATVDITTQSVTDTGAELLLTLSDNAVKVKYRWSTSWYDGKSFDSITAGLIHNSGVEATPESGKTIVLSHSELNPETEYYLAVVAYDADGNYGELVWKKFTTSALTAVEDSRYDAFIGTYIMIGTGNYLPQTVTIEEGVRGKTFVVRGLLPPNAVATYGLDNAVTAWFKDGRFVIRGGSFDNTGTSGYEYLNLCYRNNMYTWYSRTGGIGSEYNDGVLELKYEDDTNMMWTGLAFFLANGTNAYELSIGSCYDLVLTKQ